MEVKSVQGTYTLDEEPLNTSQLCEMLHIDNRTLQVSEAIAPNPIHDRYGQVFLAGVQWADEHPIEQYQNA